MKLPPGVGEADFLEIVDRVVGVLAPTHAFGCFEPEDMAQQGRVFALEALARDIYDPSRPLDAFLYTVIRSRFLNMKRDRLRRNDPPCLSCYAGDFCTNEGLPCAKFAAWDKRNTAKASLMKTVTGNPVRDVADEEDASDLAERREILLKIDLELPLDMREDYLRMRAGCSLSKSRKQEVEDAVLHILKNEL